MLQKNYYINIFFKRGVHIEYFKIKLNIVARRWGIRWAKNSFEKGQPQLISRLGRKRGKLNFTRLATCRL
jgi:hypothetical protein